MMLAPCAYAHSTASSQCSFRKWLSSALSVRASRNSAPLARPSGTLSISSGDARQDRRAVPVVRIHVLFTGHEIMRHHDGVAVAQVLKGRMRVYVRKARVENGDAETATVVAALQERFRTKPLRLVLLPAR